MPFVLQCIQYAPKQRRKFASKFCQQVGMVEAIHRKFDLDPQQNCHRLHLPKEVLLVASVS